MLPECHAKRRGPALRSACSTHAPQRRVLDFRARDEGFKWDLCQQEYARLAEVTVQPSELFRVAQGCCQLNTIGHALRQASCHPLKTSCHWLAQGSTGFYQIRPPVVLPCYRRVLQPAQNCAGCCQLTADGWALLQAGSNTLIQPIEVQVPAVELASQFTQVLDLPDVVAKKHLHFPSSCRQVMSELEYIGLPARTVYV